MISAKAGIFQVSRVLYPWIFSKCHRLKISGMSDWFREGNGQFAEKQENDFGGITEE